MIFFGRKIQIQRSEKNLVKMKGVFYSEVSRFFIDFFRTQRIEIIFSK